MDEFVKRLDEIRARAAEIAQMDEINEEARAELRALRDERTELEAKIEDVKLVAELTAEVEQPKAEEAPAEETVEETVEEVVETSLALLACTRYEIRMTRYEKGC